MPEPNSTFHSFIVFDRMELIHVSRTNDGLASEGGGNDDHQQPTTLQLECGSPINIFVTATYTQWIPDDVDSVQDMGG